jgi:hypothetical protein
MTPEFRKAIFSWNYNREKDGVEEFCIPLQLQRLFGLLQLSKTRAVDTVALTKSFGWEGSEVFQQQDVQELTRVLFDALEETFKGTEAETVIDDLYAGELIDYIRCIDVDYQSERVDKFLDFSLAIVPFGETKAMKSLAECIEMFLRPEILDGENKYYCEKYNQKVDAIKGLKFGRLPKIMSVQLKRFVYDFSGDYVVQKKLNDEVKFPMVLDMNKYIAKKRQVADNGDVSDMENEDFESFLHEQMSKLKSESSANKQDNDEPSSTIALSDIDLEDKTRDPDVPTLNSTGDSASTPFAATSDHSAIANSTVSYESMTDEEIQNLIRQRGEWIYELYAVLIHSGSVTGGHYYAYIKDLESKKWYNFNDSSVLPINEKDVEETWGGKSLYSGSAAYHSIHGTSRTTSYSSSNGYMLMYRKVGISSPLVPDDIIPQYIRDLVAVEEEKRLIRQKEEEELRNRLRIRIHWNNRENFVSVKRNNTVKEALETIWKELDLGSFFSGSESQKNDGAEDSKDSSSSEFMDLSLIRLREYNHITKLRAAAYDAGVTGEKRLSELYFNDFKHYIIETRKTDEVWEEYFTDGISILMEEFDAKTASFKDPRTVRLPKGSTLGDFKNKIASMISFDVKNVLVSKIITLAYNDGRQEVLNVDCLRLREDYTVYEGGKLVVEDSTADPENSKQSFAFRTFLNAKNKIQISYNIPPSTEFDHTIIIDGRWKIKEFRQRIADLVGLPVEECRLFKLNAKGNEFKDSDVTLTNSGVYAHMNLLVKRGKPTPPLHYPVAVYRYNARDYVPGATELPSDDPIDVANGISTGNIEIVDPDVRVDPWTTAVDDSYPLSPSCSPPDRAAAGINPYQKKIPEIVSSLSTVRETATMSSNHTDIEQIIDDEDADLQMAIALSATEEDNNADNEDASSEKCNNGDFENEQDMLMEDAEVQLNEDELLLLEAEVVTATYPAVENDGQESELRKRSSSSIGDDSHMIAKARPVMHVERSISREHSSDIGRSRSGSNHQAAHGGLSSVKQAAPCTPVREKSNVSEEAFSTPQTMRSLPKSYEAEDFEVMEQAHRRVLHLSEIQDRAQQRISNQPTDVTNSYIHPSSKKLEPLDLAVVDNYVTKNPNNPFKDDLTPNYNYNHMSDINLNGDNLMETIAAIDAAVEKANREAAAKEAERDNLLAEPSTPAAVAVEISDFGERIVKNMIIPDQFEEIHDLSLYVGPGTQVEDFRQLIHKELLSRGIIDDSVSLHRIRIREKIGNFPAKILRDGKTLQEMNVYLNDHKAFCFEILQEEENLPEDDYGDVVVQVQKWHRSSWSLSEKIDVLLPGGKCVRDIAIGLSKLFQIPFDHIRILVIPRDSSLMLSDLALTNPTQSRSWVDPRMERRLLRHMSFELRLVEGDLLLLQDFSEPLMELTPADKRSIMVVQAAQDNPSIVYAGDSNTSYSYPGTSSTKVPAWVTSTGASPVYKYPALRTSSAGTGSTSGGSNGIRIKTQKDRQREAENSSNNGDKASSNAASVGHTSPVDFLTGDGEHSSSIAVGTDDDLFLMSANGEPIMRGRYADDLEFMRQGGVALFSDLD